MARSDAEVPAGLTPVSAMEVVGLLINIFTGGTVEGFVLTTWKEMWLDRYFECGNLKVLGQNFTFEDWAICLFFLAFLMSSYSSTSSLDSKGARGGFSIVSFCSGRAPTGKGN